MLNTKLNWIKGVKGGNKLNGIFVSYLEQNWLGFNNKKIIITIKKSVLSNYERLTQIM